MLTIFFWVLLLLWIVLGPPWPGVPWPPWPGHIILFLLFVIIGLHDFGNPLAR